MKPDGTRDPLKVCLERSPQCRDAPWGVSEAGENSSACHDAPAGRLEGQRRCRRPRDAPRGVSTVGGMPTESPLLRHPLKEDGSIWGIRLSGRTSVLPVLPMDTLSLAHRMEPLSNP